MIRQSRTYSLHIERRGGKYFALVPALEGCAACATSYEQAVNRAGHAVDAYVARLQADGVPIPIEETDIPLSLGVTIRTAVISI